jgi:hypothetical protein
MLKFSLTAVLLFLAAYLAVCVALFILQRSMLYYPTPPVSTSEAEVIWLKNEEQNLKVWHVRRAGGRALLYFGGNAEDVALNIAGFKQLFPEHSIYLLNYRGYGGSSGSPTETGLLADSRALYDLAAQRHTDIDVIGRSLGTGVAVYLAANRPVRRLALVTPYDSMTSLASAFYPYLPVSWLLLDRYDSLGRAESLSGQTLIVVAEHDEVIPRKRTDALIAALRPENTRVQVISAAGHNTIGNSPSYEQALTDFFTR